MSSSCAKQAQLNPKTLKLRSFKWLIKRLAPSLNTQSCIKKPFCSTFLVYFDTKQSLCFSHFDINQLFSEDVKSKNFFFPRKREKNTSSKAAYFSKIVEIFSIVLAIAKFHSTKILLEIAMHFTDSQKTTVKSRIL